MADGRVGAGAEHGNGTSRKQEEAEETMSVRLGKNGKKNLERETWYVVTEMNEAEET